MKCKCTEKPPTFLSTSSPSVEPLPSGDPSLFPPHFGNPPFGDQPLFSPTHTWGQGRSHSPAPWFQQWQEQEGRERSPHSLQPGDMGVPWGEGYGDSPEESAAEGDAGKEPLRCASEPNQAPLRFLLCFMALGLQAGSCPCAMGGRTGSVCTFDVPSGTHGEQHLPLLLSLPSLLSPLLPLGTQPPSHPPCALGQYFQTWPPVF